ncbi:MAG: biopolymer transporter ExbD [Sneathiellaceae bacterium]
MRRLRQGGGAFGAGEPAAGGDDGSLSLVNIAFLLLAFFVIAGAITASDPFPVAPPQAGTAPADPAAPRELLLAADGRLALDGVPLSEEALVQALAADRQAAAGAGAAGLGLRLRADRNADAGDLMALLGRLRAAGLQEVTLVTVAAPDSAGAAGR